MKLDEFGCLIREKYTDPKDWLANCGDSCAESSRAVILGDNTPNTLCFVDDYGFMRHPKLALKSGWGYSDTTNDQVLPLFMAWVLRNGEAPRPTLFIRQTWKPVSIGVFSMMTKQYWLLNLANIVQGWIFKLKFRIADGGKIERTEGKVQDYLNMICIYVFLKRMNRWATLPRPKDECLAAVRKYYLEGDDWEPNSEWIVQLYRKELT